MGDSGKSTGQDEEMGMTTESAMQLVRMMAAELGVVEYRIPLNRTAMGKTNWAYLYLPKDFKVADADRMSGFIRTFVMEEREEEVIGEDDRKRKLAEALARRIPRKTDEEMRTEIAQEERGGKSCDDTSEG